MTNTKEVNIAILTMLTAAEGLLRRAEVLHGQPLYYDPTGTYHNVPDIVEHVMLEFQNGSNLLY